MSEEVCWTKRHVVLLSNFFFLSFFEYFGAVELHERLSARDKNVEDSEEWEIGVTCKSRWNASSFIIVSKQCRVFSRVL